MFAYLLLATVSVGDFLSINVSDPKVKSVSSYLTKAIPQLFPEADGRPEITSAERQVVAGYNVRLSIKMARNLAFSITLYVNLEGKIRIIAIAPLKNEEQVPGTFEWGEVNSLTTADLDSIQSTLSAENGFNGKIATVLAVRDQPVKNGNRHIIFADEARVLHSAVLSRDENGNQKLDFFRTVNGD
jgi:hypothetical protein